MQGTSHTAQVGNKFSVNVKHHYHNLGIIQVLDSSTFFIDLLLAYLEKMKFVSYLLLSQFHNAGASLASFCPISVCLASDHDQKPTFLLGVILLLPRACQQSSKCEEALTSLCCLVSCTKTHFEPIQS